MKIYTVENNSDGTAKTEALNADRNDYEIVGRFWVSGDKVIREWTTEEYVNYDPKLHKSIPFCVDGCNLVLDAHCAELRQVYARNKFGHRVVGFQQKIDYDKM